MSSIFKGALMAGVSLASAIRGSLVTAALRGQFGPALNLNFLSGTLDPRITFSRGSNATLVDSTGKITYAPANFFTFSEQFDNAAWSKTNTTVTANSTTAPNGTLTADTLTATAGTAISVRMGQSGATITSTTYVTSFYVRPGTHTFVQIHINAQSADWVNFTLTGSGTVQNNGAAVGAISFDSATGYYRISATYTAGSTDRTPFFGIVPSGTATRNQTWNPTGTETVFVWGAQFEPVTYQTAPGVYNATTSAAYYGPRFDYDPVTLAPKGLLIEEARTNLATYSNDFADASWAKSAITGSPAILTPNVAVSPDGATNADRLITASAGTGGNIFQASSFAVSTTYTQSVFAKKDAWNWIVLQNSIDPAFIESAWFNVSTGTIGTVTAGATATITPFGNGWYRCTMTRTMGASIVSSRARIYSTNGDNTYSTGDGTSGVLLYGAQLEAGSFATSYIPTDASTVTRSADVATMTGTNFSSWYNQSEGTMIVGYSRIQTTDTFGMVWEVKPTSASSSDRINVAASNVADPRFQVFVGGVSQLDTTTTFGPVALGAIVNTSLAYKSGDLAAVRNGSAPSTSASTFAAPSYTNLQIGGTDNAIFGPAASSFLNGHIRQLAYYNTRLPNAQLQGLTA